MTRSNYWRKRMDQEMAANIERDKSLRQVYEDLFTRSRLTIQDELESYYQRYADKEGLTIDRSRQIASSFDVEGFMDKARQYVQTQDFSDKANQELKLYNFAMRANQQELLQASVTMALEELKYGEIKQTESFITEEALRTYKQQAGILELSVPSPEIMKQKIQAISQTNFKGAKWSDRIWQRQQGLSNQVEQIVQGVVVQGRNPREFVGQLRQAFNVSTSQAHRLAVTESARVQTGVQKENYLENGVEKYQYLAEPTACDICADLHDQIFSVKDMQPGSNAAPMHPNCHCSTGPVPDEEGLERILEELETKESEDGILEIHKDYQRDESLGRQDYIDLLQEDFDMEIQETSRTKIPEYALEQVYSTIKRFEDVYNKLPDKVPVLRIVPASKGGNTVAWYRHQIDGLPVEFGLNAKFFKDSETLARITKRNVKSGFYSKNDNADRTMLHEFAHHIDFNATKLTNMQFSDRVFGEMYKKYGDKYWASDIGEQVGRYAEGYYKRRRSNIESFAELFAEAYGDTPRQIALDFKEVFEATLREVLE